MTTPLCAEPIDRLRRRTSIKWSRYPEDMLPLFVAEMDYALAAPIARALHAAIDLSDTGYCPEEGRIGEAFAGFARRRWGWELDPAGVSTTTDVSVVLVETLRLVVRPGDGVVVNPPIYPPFYEVVEEAHAVPVEVPLLDDGECWSIDLEGLERAFAAGARAYLLCSPHNPVGLVHPRETLERVAELAARYDVTVVSDEIHAPLTHPGAGFVPFLDVSPAAREHGVTATSASKSWNVAGLKCALFVAASERTRALLGGLTEEVWNRTGLLGRLAGEVAFSDPEAEAWLDAAIAAFRENSDRLGALLAERMPDVGYRPPQASYLAWLDFRAADWGDDPSVRARAAGVALNSGPSFGAPGRGHTRLNLACAPAVLEEAVDRLARG